MDHEQTHNKKCGGKPIPQEKDTAEIQNPECTEKERKD
jgi:hypothetical protein